MPSICTTRREVLAGAVGLAALGSRSAMAATAPALPSSPVTLNIIDVAGNLQLTQGAIEEYARANPKLISRVTFSQAPAPELLKVSSQDVLLLGCLVQYGFEDKPAVVSILTEVLGENKSLNTASPEKLTALAEKFIEAINKRGEDEWRKAEERDKALGKKHVGAVSTLPRSILNRINHFAE